MNTENVATLYNFDAVKNKGAIDRSLQIWKRYPKNLLSIGNDAKTKKGNAIGVLTGVLYEAPADTASQVSLCPMAKMAGCESACLYHAGRGRFSNVQQARIRKTLFIDQYPQLAYIELINNIERLVAKAYREGLTPAVRLNGTSDRDWDKWSSKHGLPSIFKKFPNVQFYDYTKVLGRMIHANHHQTFSYSDRDEYKRKAVLPFLKGEHIPKMGVTNMAVAFHGKDIPAEFLGIKVINGDKTDARFQDPDGVFVGLTFKGAAENDTDGFAVPAESRPK